MSFVENCTQSMAPDGRRGALVVGLRRTSTGDVFTLDGGRRRWVLGSSSSCDIVIEDPFVSGRHCMIERRSGGAIVVRDSESRNGTYIDGNPVEGAELRVGSYLSIGRTTLVAIAASTGERPRAIELLRGRDPGLRSTIDQALRAAPTDCSVLILGETGTGKDLLARVLHESSRRANGPFVAVNCGAIPRELVASELFGHEKGAFTGAADGRDGFFVEANGGTLFLDELGELPIELQPNLLRVLETRRVRRVGGQSDRQVDVRIVAATNRTEGLGTDSSRLRVDLYHRLATVVLSLPPLRDRMSDIGDLVEGMLADLAAEFGPKRVTAAGWEALASYAWPGNVRELRHAIARAVALGPEELGPLDFFPDIGHARRRHAQGTAPTPTTLDLNLPPYHAVLRGAMEQALQKHGSIRAAASSIGMPKSTFADKATRRGASPRAARSGSCGRRRNVVSMDEVRASGPRPRRFVRNCSNVRPIRHAWSHAGVLSLETREHARGPTARLDMTELDDDLAQLRAALFAFLVANDIGVSSPLIGELRDAIARVEAHEAPSIEDVRKMLVEFRAEAIRIGKPKFAYSPLFPWGVVGYVDGLQVRLRYREASREHRGPCNCALVIAHDLISMLDTQHFVKTGSSDDFYDPYEDFECPSCGVRWRHQDSSTEQYTSFHWVLIR